MARSLSGFSLLARLQATLANGLDGGAQSASAIQGVDFSPAVALTSGTGDDAADRIWSDTGRAITSGANDDIDVYDLGSIDIGAGAGRDAVGQTVTLAEVVAFLIVNKSTSTGTITVGGEGSTAAWNSPFGGSDTATFGPIKPGGFLFAYSPDDPAWAVADTSNHLLRIAASGGNVEVDVCILGRSA